MKYSVILTDGAADYPVPELDGKTPFEVAKKPCIDALAKKSELGMLHVTPDGCKGGSEIGNLCVMGYDPRVYLTGRSPLEARSLGIEMNETDLALRCNLVTLSADEPYEQKTMVDNTASEISTEDAKALMEDVQKEFGSELRSTAVTAAPLMPCTLSKDGRLMRLPCPQSQSEFAGLSPFATRAAFIGCFVKKSKERF